MLNPKNLIFLILMVSWACNGSNSEGDQYSYDEMVEIYSVSDHLSDQEEIRSRLTGPLDLESKRNQFKYGRSLRPLNQSRSKWNQFIKDTVEFYIHMQKTGKNTMTKLYKIKAYEKNSNRFNDNDLLESQKNLPPNYWKVVFIRLKRSGRVVFCRERYNNNRMTLRVYYNMKNRFKVREERLMDYGTLNTTYFDSNKKLSN